ncbi:MAG TPA: thiamine pyrophosphate-dependent dehydrogenase E1 component subunit alpha [Candidatus Dormibacteraeota bacterium]|nr:thiamine pyrophosphate-dependent dehydrogenase E1 component subunit alpha [Candidatus Dormibacteraeota bacterium]
MATKVNRAAAAVETTATRHSPELLLGLYRMMVKCRMCDEKARILFRQGKYGGNFYSNVGQEAGEVGSLYSLRKEDWVGPTHRDWTSGIIKGIPLTLSFAQLFGKVDSTDRGKSTPAHMGHPEFHVITPASTIGAQLMIGTGVAWGIKRRQSDACVVAFCGDGGTSLGWFHEAMNFAGVHRLPLICVVQNNLWAESVPIRLQTALTNLSDRAKAYGIAGVTVDGNDILAVYDAATEAIARARGGQGPTILECKTYRWYGHSEIDPAKYRIKEEVEEWKKKDPIAHFEKFLADHKLLNDQQKKQTRDEITREIDEAVEFAEKSPYPAPEEALDHIWA